MSEAILSSVTDSVLTITLNRPEARNALTYEMYEAIAALCVDAGARDDIRAVILIGHAGAFGSGTDIALFRDLITAADSMAYEARMERVFRAIETCARPTIAAISGACTGGAACIAACCDMRIGTADARIGFPIARTLGNALSSRNLARMVKLVGEARVKEMVFTARLYDGAEAKAAGFISESVDDFAMLQARAQTLARAIAAHAPMTLNATKQGLDRIARQDWRDEDLVTACYTSADFREGMEAFLAKRKPQWRGK